MIINGTTYPDGTDETVIRILEDARAGGYRVRLHYGYTREDQRQTERNIRETASPVGQDWLEESGVEGRIGRSMGPIRIPLILANSRSTGGGGLLADCIVKITRRDGRGRECLYLHPQYRMPCLALHAVPGSAFDTGRLGYVVRADGKEHAGFKTTAAGVRYIHRMQD